MRSLALALLSAGAAMLLCAGCETYVQHRAALVPHAAPVQNIGQPNESRGSLAVGATNIVDLRRPGVGDPSAGVAIPSRQLRGAIGLALSRNLTFGLVHERGLASSAQPVKDTLPPLDDRTVAGGGVSLSYSIETQSPWRIGISTELIGWKVPFVEYSTCIDLCPNGPYTTITRAETLVMTLGLGFVPSYRLGDWMFFGGLTLRNHPTIEEKVIETGYDESADVTAGPLNAVGHAGVAFDATDRVRFRLDIHQALTRDPVAYAPGIGFAFEVGFGSAVRKEPPQPPAAATPWVPADPAARRYDAAQLQPQAHAAARAGECDRARELMARIQLLDAAAYAVSMQDKLIAYCVSP
jgi:hypothetical protein